MKILVNDREHEIAAPCTVAALLEALGHAGRTGLAVAVNDEVVPRGLWTERGLSEGDRVLLIRATQGG